MIGPQKNEMSGSLDQRVSLSALPRRMRNVIEHNFWKEVLLYSFANQKAFALNTSAKAIWDLCDGKHTIIEISEELGQRFGCSSDELLSDVINATTRLYQHGVVEMKETPCTKSP
jgi:hypothetical protein